MRAVALSLGLLAACAGGDPAGDTDDVDDGSCPEAGAVRVLATGFDRSGSGGSFGTEGATITSEGAVYVTARETLETIAADGTVSEVAPLPSSIGLTWWDGAVWGTSNDDVDGTGEHALVETVPGEAPVRHVLETTLSTNFLTPTPWGTLLVADPGEDGIFEWTPGASTLTTWKEGVPSPNGMAFTPDGATLYVAHTFREAGLSAIAVDGEAAGALTRLVDVAAADAPDGIALDEDGAVWITLNTGRRIDVWRDGALETVVEDIAFPASLAFGRGAWDPCEAVVTSLFSGDVFAVQTGVRGFFPPWEDEAGRP